MKAIVTLFSLLLFWFSGNAQIDENQLGAWYMLFWNAEFNESPWGVQGDLQYRNWDIAGDLEQLLIRGGVTFKPKNENVKFTLGYANITSGAFGDSNAKSGENRIYQEALIPQRIGQRFFLTHRFRYEQRYVEEQDFRTRYRYNLFVNVPLTSKDLSKNTLYLALYNELFINGQRRIGDERSVEIFDRDRFYAALGYAVKDNLKIQFGFMRQTTDNLSKRQLQFSLHADI